jgi:hypothetical protein
MKRKKEKRKEEKPIVSRPDRDRQIKKSIKIHDPKPRSRIRLKSDHIRMIHFGDHFGGNICIRSCSMTNSEYHSHDLKPQPRIRSKSDHICMIHFSGHIGGYICIRSCGIAKTNIIAKTPNHNCVSDLSRIISVWYISAVISVVISVSGHVASQKANIIAIWSQTAKYDSPTTQKNLALLGKTKNP